MPAFDLLKSYRCHSLFDLNACKINASNFVVEGPSIMTVSSVMQFVVRCLLLIVLAVLSQLPPAFNVKLDADAFMGSFYYSDADGTARSVGPWVDGPGWRDPVRSASGDEDASDRLSRLRNQKEHLADRRLQWEAHRNKCGAHIPSALCCLANITPLEGWTVGEPLPKIASLSVTSNVKVKTTDHLLPVFPIDSTDLNLDLPLRRSISPLPELDLSPFLKPIHPAGQKPSDDRASREETVPGSDVGPLLHSDCEMSNDGSLESGRRSDGQGRNSDVESLGGEDDDMVCDDDSLDARPEFNIKSPDGADCGSDHDSSNQMYLEPQVERSSILLPDVGNDFSPSLESQHGVIDGLLDDDDMSVLDLNAQDDGGLSSPPLSTQSLSTLFPVLLDVPEDVNAPIPTSVKRRRLIMVSPTLTAADSLVNDVKFDDRPPTARTSGRSGISA